MVKQSSDKPVGRQVLYSMASRHAEKALLRLVELLDSKNESVALGAARTLLDKTLPSVKALEGNLVREDERPMIILDTGRKISVQSNFSETEEIGRADL